MTAQHTTSAAAALAHAASPGHPLLEALVLRARQQAAAHGALKLGLVYPCDRLALQAAAAIAAAGIARPVLIGPAAAIAAAAAAAQVDASGFERVATPTS